MKDMRIHQLSIMVFVTTIIYIVGVLMGASFNPWEWEETIRGFLAMIWGASMVIALVFPPPFPY